MDTFYACLFYLWAPSVMQGVLLLIHFGYALVQLGELPPRKIIIRNYRTRMRHIYFNLRRWLDPERNPRYRERTRKRKWTRFRRFRRRRLAFHMLNRCRQRKSVHTPTLDGRRVPTQRSRRHRCWRRRKTASKSRQLRRRVFHHEFFLRVRAARKPLDEVCSDERLDAFCKTTDFLTPMKMFKGFEEDDHQVQAQETVARMNHH